MEKNVGRSEAPYLPSGRRGQDPAVPSTSSTEQTGRPRPLGPPGGQLPAPVGTPPGTRPVSGGPADVKPHGVSSMPSALSQSQPRPAGRSFTQLENDLSTFTAGIGKLNKELPTVNRERARTGAICRVINDCNTHKDGLRILCHGETNDPSQAGILRSQARDAIWSAVTEACTLLKEGSPNTLRQSVVCQVANGIRGLRACCPFEGTLRAQQFDAYVDTLEALLLQTIQKPAIYQACARPWKPKEYEQVIIALPTIAGSCGLGPTFDPSPLFGSVIDKRDPPDSWNAWAFASTLDALGLLVTGQPPALRTEQVSGVATHLASCIVDTLTTSVHNDFTPLDCRQALNALLQLRRAGVDFGKEWAPVVLCLLNQIAKLGGSAGWSPHEVFQTCRTLRSLLDDGFLPPSEPALQAALDTLLPLSFCSDKAFKIACDIQERIDVSLRSPAEDRTVDEAAAASPRKKQDPKKAAPSTQPPTERPVKGRGGKVPVSPRAHQGPRQSPESAVLQRMLQCETPKDLRAALAKSNAPAALATATTDELLGLWRRLLEGPLEGHQAEDAVTALAKAVHASIANIPANELPQCVSALTALVRKSPADAQLAATVIALAERIGTVAQQPCQLRWICDIVTAWAPLAKLLPDTIGSLLETAQAAAGRASKTLQGEKFDFSRLSAMLRALARLSAVEDEPALLDDFIKALAKRISEDKSPKNWSKASRAQAVVDIAMFGPNNTQLPSLLNTLAGRAVAGPGVTQASQIVYELFKDEWTTGKIGTVPVMTIPWNTSRDVTSIFVCGVYDAADSTVYIPSIKPETPEGLALVHEAERTWAMSRIATLWESNAWFDELDMQDPVFQAMMDERSSAFQKIIVALGQIYVRLTHNEQVPLTPEGRKSLAEPVLQFILATKALPPVLGEVLFIGQPPKNLAYFCNALYDVLPSPDLLEPVGWPTLDAVKWVQEVIRGSMNRKNLGSTELSAVIESFHTYLDKTWYPLIEKSLPPRPAKDDDSSDEDDPIEQPAGAVPTQSVAIAKPSAGPRRIDQVLVLYGPGVLPEPGPSEQELLEKFKLAAGQGMEVTVVGNGRRALSMNDLTGLKLAPSSSAIVLMRQAVTTSDTHLLSYTEGNTWKTGALLEMLRKKGVKEFHVFAKGDDMAARNIKAQPKLLDDGKVTCNIYSGHPVAADAVAAMIKHHAQGNLVDDPDSDRGTFVRENIAQDTGTRVHNVFVDPVSKEVKDEVFSPAQ